MLSPAWTTDWMSEEGRRKLRAYGIAPPQAQARAARCSAQQPRRLPALRLGRYRAACPNSARPPARRSGAAGLPRAVRLFQMSLTCPQPHRDSIAWPSTTSAARRPTPFRSPSPSRSDSPAITPSRPASTSRSAPRSTARRCAAPIRSAPAPTTASSASPSRRSTAARFRTAPADELKSGDELDVMTPTGRFGVVPPADAGRIHVGFAAGSGITPILSIVKGVLAREPDSRFFLFYGNRIDRQHHVPRGARGAQGPLHRSPLDLPRHLRRGAGHPDPARPARRRQGEGAAALAGAGGQRRSCLHLRSVRHERGHRGDLPRVSASRRSASMSSASSPSSAASRGRRRPLLPTRRRRRSPR